MTIRISLFGTPAVQRAGAEVHLDTRKAIALAANLAMTDGPQPRDTVAALLWPDADTGAARGSLRRTLSTLKACLGDGVDGDRQALMLRMDALEIDVVSFRRVLKRAGSHGHPISQVCSDCLPLLLEAIDLYRGDFLAGFTLRDAPDFHDWQAVQSEALRREMSQALEGASHTLTDQAEFDQAISTAKRLLALDPLHEPAHQLLMQIYFRAGRRAAAIQQYRECVRILDQELAVSPVEETTRLYQAITDGTIVESRVSTNLAPIETAPTIGLLPLVGREGEWKTLTQAFDLMTHSGHTVVIEGEAGIGKTRLVEDFLEYARSNHAVTISARGYEGETNIAYGLLAQVLRAAVDILRRSGAVGRSPSHDLTEAARLLPDLGAPVSIAGRGAGTDVEGLAAHTRFLESVSRIILSAAGNAPLVLAMDDFQWADPASVEFTGYFIRGLGGRRAGVVLAARTGDTQPLGLQRLIATASRAHSVTALALARLEYESVQQLVESVTASSPIGREESLVDIGSRLFQETEGLPLFVAEYLNALRSGSLDPSLPQGVSDLLLSRLGNLSDSALQILTAASVIGRSFDFEILKATSGRDEEMTIEALEELGTRALIQDLDAVSSGKIAYDFTHDKLRSLVYERTSLARRRLLHRRAAQALADRYVGRDDSYAGQIAGHYQLAGMQTEAASFHAKAGEQARAVYAGREALSHFEAALALGEGHAAALHEALGDTHLLLGEYRLAVERYEATAALVGGFDLARIEHKLGTAYTRWGEWELAESHYATALDVLGEGSSADHARLYADWGLAAHHNGDTARGLELAQVARKIAERTGDVWALAQAHNILGVLERALTNTDAARDHLQRSLDLANQLPKPEARLAPMQNLVIVLRRSEDFEGARATAVAALALSRASGDRHREAALNNAMADLLHDSGESDEAMTYLKNAVSIYAEIGVEEGQVRPEVWKLSEW